MRTLLLLLLLALIGFICGSWASKPLRTETIEKPAVGSTDETIGVNRPANHDLRDPRTGATFAESREQLHELSRSAKKIGGVSYILERQRHGEAHLEIERIFALASQEDLVAFFAEDDLTDDTILLSAAFARFSTLAPEVAVSVWEDLFRRTKKPAGIDGLVEAWAGMDPAAAERWVDAITDPKLRQGALASLLMGAVETDPSMVERRLTDLDEIEDSMDLAYQLAWDMDPPGLSAFASRLLDENRGKWQNQNQLFAVLKVWAERDSTSMFAWILEQSPSRFGDHIIPRVAEAGAKADPVAFVRGIGPSLDQNPALAEMAGEAWMSWLASGIDEEEALGWFNDHGAKLKLSQRSWFSGAKTSESAIRMLKSLSTLPDNELTKKFTGLVMENLAESDPEAALELAMEKLPADKERDSYLASALGHLARKGDPALAVDWAVGNLPAGQGLIDAVRGAMWIWAEKQPRLAAEHALKLPTTVRDEALGNVAYQWSQRSPDQVVGYMSEVSDPAIQKILARNAFFQFGLSQGGETVLARAQSLPDEILKAEAVGALFDGWSQANLETSGTALKSLVPGPIRDAAIMEFVGNAARTDRNAALAWSLQIAEPQKRREVTMRQSRDWLISDREAATRWIESNESLPAAWKAELLKREK